MNARSRTERCALTFTLGLAVMPLIAQNIPNPTQRTSPAPVEIQPTPLFKINVVARTIPAVNYLHRGGSTKINFAGTALAPPSISSCKRATPRAG